MKEKGVRKFSQKKGPALMALFPMVFGILTAGILGAGCAGSGFTRQNGNFFGYAPGIYEGSARGFRGPIHVQVEVSPAGIEDIVITGHEEWIYPGVAAMEELLDLVLETGSTDLDAVSGATFSSRGFLEAVEDALTQAQGRVK